MRSWVFRHRIRLRVVYGVGPAAAQLPPATAARSARGDPPPGSIVRRGSFVILRPPARAS